MQIALLSDLHTEFSDGDFKLGDALSPEAQAACDVLILGGDIGEPFTPTYQNLLKDCSRSIKCTLVIAGNREYYANGATMAEVDAQIDALCRTLGNVHYLNNREITLGSVTFIGSTLWSHIPPERADTVSDLLCFWEVFTAPDQRLTPEIVTRMFHSNLDFLARALDRARARRAAAWAARAASCAAAASHAASVAASAAAHHDGAAVAAAAVVAGCAATTGVGAAPVAAVAATATATSGSDSSSSGVSGSSGCSVKLMELAEGGQGEEEQEQAVVVITHHAPLLGISQPPEFRGGPHTSAYASDLRLFIQRQQQLDEQQWRDWQEGRLGQQGQHQHQQRHRHRHGRRRHRHSSSRQDGAAGSDGAGVGGGHSLHYSHRRGPHRHHDDGEGHSQHHHRHQQDRHNHKHRQHKHQRHDHSHAPLQTAQAPVPAAPHQQLPSPTTTTSNTSSAAAASPPQPAGQLVELPPPQWAPQSLLQPPPPLLAMWVSGHTHHNFDVMLGRTRMVTNQYGYSKGRPVRGFRRRLLLEVPLPPPQPSETPVASSAAEPLAQPAAQHLAQLQQSPAALQPFSVLQPDVSQRQQAAVALAAAAAARTCDSAGRGSMGHYHYANHGAAAGVAHQLPSHAAADEGGARARGAGAGPARASCDPALPGPQRPSAGGHLGRMVSPFEIMQLEVTKQAGGSEEGKNADVGCNGCKVVEAGAAEVGDEGDGSGDGGGGNASPDKAKGARRAQQLVLEVLPSWFKRFVDM